MTTASTVAAVASDVNTVETDAKAVVAQFQSDLDFVKANWLKLNLVLIAAGLAGVIVGYVLAHIFK